MIRTRIIGTGSYVPPDILTNDNLSEIILGSDIPPITDVDLTTFAK